MDRRGYPRTDLRLDVSPGWPSRLPSSTVSCTSAPRQASCSDACPSLRGASSFETSTRTYASTTRRHAPSWATRSTKASTSPPRSLMPVRSSHLRRVPVLRPQVQPSCTRPPNHPRHVAFRRVGAGHRRALAKSTRGLHPPIGRHRQVLQVGRGAPNHESQGGAVLTVDFGTPSYEFTVNICTYLIF
jgi:hypothetical protein